MNREKLAWAAGFFDGEGSFAAHPNARKKPGQKLCPRIDIGQIDRPILERFQRAVGFGLIRGPYQKYSTPNQKPLWRLGVYRFEEVQAIGAMLWSFLSQPKRHQFAEVMGRYRKSRLEVA